MIGRAIDKALEQYAGSDVSIKSGECRLTGVNIGGGTNGPPHLYMTGERTVESDG